jgi:hypothetical protein
MDITKDNFPGTKDGIVVKNFFGHVTWWINHNKEVCRALFWLEEHFVDVTGNAKGCMASPVFSQPSSKLAGKKFPFDELLEVRFLWKQFRPFVTSLPTSLIHHFPHCLSSCTTTHALRINYTM